jgi:hypothetical protein
MDKTLTLITTKNKIYNFEILTVAWVNNPNGSYIEIVAKNATLQTDAKFYPGLAKPELASQFHDKLLAVYGKINTQITAYTNKATVTSTTDIDLDKSIVYLIV